MERELEVAASKLLKRAAQAGVFLSYSREKLLFKVAAEIFPQELKSEIVAKDPCRPARPPPSQTDRWRALPDRRREPEPPRR